MTKKIIILGGGPSGLSMAWQIGLLKQGESALYEKADNVGGVCGYYDFNGLKLDYGPHKIYSVLPGIMDAFRDLAGDRIKEVEKSHKIIVRGRILDYPVKLGQILSLFTLSEVIALGFSILATVVKKPFIKNTVSYEDYCIGIFGKKVYDTVFRSLAEKIWGDPKTLSADIARTRIPARSVFDLIFRMIGLKKESEHTNAKFMLYPPRGFYDICECMADKVKEQGCAIHLRRKPIRFVREGNRIKSVIFDDMSEQKVDLVISSIPLEELMGLLYPEDINAAGKYFIRMRNCMVVYFLISKPRVMEDHWIFCADKETAFSRISEQKLFSDMGFPGDKTVVSCDFTCDEDDAVWKEKDSDIAERCIRDLEKLKLLGPCDVIDYRVARIPHFYPVYDIGYEKKIVALFDKINQTENIICTGRLGLCSYNNIDHCLDMGILIAKGLAQGKQPAHINNELLQRARPYRIID